VAGSARGSDASHRAQVSGEDKTHGAANRCKAGIGGEYRDARCQGVHRDEKNRGLHPRAAPPEQRAELAGLIPQILGLGEVVTTAQQLQDVGPLPRRA